MERTNKNKVMTLEEAVSLINDGDTVGVGGFTVSRTQSALAHEIIRQEKRDLTLVSTSLGLQMDLMVAAGCVRRVEFGAASMERFGLTYSFRRAVEQGTIEFEDYTHLGMASRLMAGELGLPFMPVKGFQGTDLETQRFNEKKLALVEDPFNPGDPPVTLLPALNPDVAILHVQKADRRGNLLVGGCLFHEVHLARAADKVIVTCEEVVSEESFLLDPESTTLPFLYVTAVVHQPWGAYPTSCYGYYDYDREHLERYQGLARDESAVQQYLEENVYGTDFPGFLEKNLTFARAEELRGSMKSLIYDGGDDR